MWKPALVLIVVTACLLPGCGQNNDLEKSQGETRDLTDRALSDFTAYVPPQCFTKTRAPHHDRAANPCYSCHTEGQAPNFIDDSDLQRAYDFANPTRTAKKHNPWRNLFADFSKAVADTPDNTILNYVRSNNYRGPRGHITLARRLARTPKGWDANHNGRWDGYMPDLYFEFDEHGYDRTPDGGYTGWRAFAYTPMPGSFLPANGAFDDVLIRLPKAFRQEANGHFDIEIYTLNFAILEALIKRTDIAIDPVDEADYGVDLNRNGKTDTTRRVVFDWAPLEGHKMTWVGRAGAQRAKLAAGLYPKGTEFIHSLRYLDVEDGRVVRAPRMKELRYARKQDWLSYSALGQRAFQAVKEAHDFPDRPERFRGNEELGTANGQGWIYQGFIEDRGGELRPQTFAETQSCMGCHGAIGATTDSSFAFARKRSPKGPDRGWYYWTQRAMAKLSEPRLTDGRGEYSTYLRTNFAGDEFRNNREIIGRFFTEKGAERPAAFQRLHRAIGEMILPNSIRALALDKAYRQIVRTQSFNDGRSAHVVPMKNVYRKVKAGEPTDVDTPVMLRHAPAD